MIKLPEAFETYTRNLMGEELYNTLIRGLNEEDYPTSIRLNPYKPCRVNSEIVKAPVPWCKDAYYLNTRPAFTFDPLFHAGSYYVQEASSMFIDQIIRQYITEPILALDLCAAPGGKTTCVRAALPKESILVANEPMCKRAQILSENILKFGHDNVAVTNNYPKDFQKTKLLFDLIIADVPCSGEGMFRKDANAIEEWSEENVEKCWRLQRSIIEDIWDNLKPGGILIYSTCTFNAHENEENVAWILSQFDAESIPVEVKEDWIITGSLIGNPFQYKELHSSSPNMQSPICHSNFFVYRFIPGKTQGEGLFMAALRKNINDAHCVSTPFSFASEQRDKVVNKLKKLKIINFGPKEGIVKGKNIIPDTSMALSAFADNSEYPQVEIDYTTSINYLRHEAITLANNAPCGIVILTYKGHPLGFAKNLGNRANNLYPQEWRIKSTYIPEEPIIVR